MTGEKMVTSAARITDGTEEDLDIAQSVDNNEEPDEKPASVSAKWNHNVGKVGLRRKTMEQEMAAPSPKP